MTRIPALPPASSYLSNTPVAANTPRALSTRPDFQSHLKAQSTPPPLPPKEPSAQVLAESADDVSRRPDVEAVLQLIASRKITSNAPSKTGRSVPGTLASGLSVPDFSFADHDVQGRTQMIDLTRAVEHGTDLCPEPLEEPTAWSADTLEGDFIEGPSAWGGLNAAAIAVALSGTTRIWTPTEIVRAPLQSPRIRIWRRRQPVAVDESA